MKEMFNVSEEKKDPIKNFKHRDLLNPNKQKRKHAGIKLNTPNWFSFLFICHLFCLSPFLFVTFFFCHLFVINLIQVRKWQFDTFWPFLFLIISLFIVICVVV